MRQIRIEPLFYEGVEFHFERFYWPPSGDPIAMPAEFWIYDHEGD